MELFHSQIFIILLCIFSIYFIVYIISKIECKLYKISHYNIKNSKNNSKLSIVFLSDFHNKSFGKGNSRIIDTIISLKPDVILLGGDFVNFSSFHSAAKNPTFDNAINFLESLSEKLSENAKNTNSNIIPIYFVLGNHESRLHKRLPGFYNMFIDRINKMGIKILEGESIAYDGITITGFSAYDGYYTNIFGKVANKLHIFEELDKKCKKADDNKFNIMLFHKPDYAEDFWEYGYDLVLSGHNHGGLIRFPYFGSFFSPDLKFLPKYSYGHYETDGKHLVVSNGIGEHFIKIRVNNRPEICHIDIN